ncbi:MAG: hypothetical protein LBN38_05460 [Verrucomicrobiota bacterium]|jgi:hypothetical protein|nr:hypothetical protein [Verrucomicrobiota bacterium]
MKTSARLFGILALALSAATPCRGVIATTWLDEPIVLWSEFHTRYSPLDLNNDGITDFVFGYEGMFLGLRSEGDNQYLIWPSGGNDYGGDVEPLPEGFEIGPNSGDDSWMKWFGDGTGYDNLETFLNGSGGVTNAGRFVGQRSYIGVEFDIDGATHYGWIDIAVAPYRPAGTLYGWGYETVPGVSILAGVVPEPSTLHLIAIGAAACLLPPRRKKT